MNHPIHIGHNIRLIRLLRGIKQEHFATFMNLTQQKVSKLENRRTIPFELLQRVAVVLGVSVEVILQFDATSLLHAAANRNTGTVAYPVQEMIDYFRSELALRDLKIKELENELYRHRYGRAGKMEEGKQSWE